MTKQEVDDYLQSRGWKPARGFHVSEGYLELGRRLVSLHFSSLIVYPDQLAVEYDEPLVMLKLALVTRNVAEG